MAKDLHRQRVLDFLEAFYSGDLERALACCCDDIDFIAHAPVDLLPHMGHRKGKDEVLTMWQTVHARYSEMRHEVPIIVADGEKAAAYIRGLFRKRSNDRVVQIDIGDFYSFRGGRIVQIRQFLDSFDLVQQVLERDVAADLADGNPGSI